MDATIRSPSKQKIAVSSHGEIHLALDPYVCDARIEALESDGRAAWTCSELPDLGALHDLVSVPGPDGIPELWIASMSGGVVHRVNGEWREVEAMRAIPQRSAAGFFVSPRGGIWAFGFGFVVRLALVNDEWQIVERLGGWQGVAGEVRSLWEESDGNVWLASWRGLTQVPASARVNPGSAPATQLLALRVDGETRPDDAAIPPDHRVVEIEFAARSLRDPRRVRYRMRLDGVEWIESREPLLRMAGVAAGDHEIEAAASLDGINWGPSGRLQFHVDPPWYARGLVVSFGIAMIIAIGLLAHGLRTAHLLDLERQRVRIAMDLHDELGAGLGSLGILGGVVADGSAPSHERQRLGEQIARTSAELGSSLHDIVYSLRTGEARLDSLGEQLANRGRTLFTGKNVRLTTSLARCPQCALAPSVSRHAYRIAVEALHNAARHANAANVHIGIESTELGRIRLWIQDDGQGIDPATLAEPGGMGLVAMRQRALAIGGDLTIQSTPENGTRIEMTFDGQGRRVHSIAWRRVWQRATSAVLHS